MSTSLKKFYCPLHGTTENVRVAAVSPDGDRTIRVHLECMTCNDHLGTTVILPFETMHEYDLPELGSNIYNPLKNHLRRLDDDSTDGIDPNEEE